MLFIRFILIGWLLVLEWDCCTIMPLQILNMCFFDKNFGIKKASLLTRFTPMGRMGFESDRRTATTPGTTICIFFGNKLE